jgi:serine/threonine protein kinase
MDEELSRYVIEELEGLEEGVRQGSGSFGSVYKVRVNGMPCIAKRLHDILSNRQVAVSGAAGGGTIRERFRNECLLLSRIRHPNIVQFLGVHYGPNSSDLTLVLEHLHMDLEQCLATYPRMPLSIKLGVLKDVSYGLLHLHTRKPPIVHRDLTVSNILVTPDMRAKIADLGVSRLLDISPLQLSNYTACPGTLAYMPPEALRPEPVYDVRLDIFSFGVLALFAAIQEFPNVYYGMDIPEAVQIDGKSELHKRGDAMRKLSTGHCLHELIVRCLSDDADKRPVAVEVNRTMKALCVNLPKRFPSVLEMHGEIWKLHGEREQLVKRLSLEKQSSDQSQPSQERPSDDLVQQMLSLREENETLRRKNTEFEERIKELEQQQNDLTPLQQAQQDYEDEVRLFCCVVYVHTTCWTMHV